MTYYELLEISENASEEVIHMAYKALVKKYHPDIYIGDKSFAEEKMKAINEAYSVLSDSEKRSEYDSFLKCKKSESENKSETNATEQAAEQPVKVKKRKLKKWIVLVVALIIATLFVLPLVSNDIEAVKDSVVMIKAYDKDDNEIATGSGFCAFNENYIVTNYHVIEGAYKIYFITDDGLENVVTDVLIYNKSNDLAILKGVTKLKPIPIGTTDNLKAGDKVYAIGSPEGQLNTVSEGIVSNADDDYQIRITAPISPGSSGGVLLNSRNKVIGITYATYDDETAQNLNYAINVVLLNDMYSCLVEETYTVIPNSFYKKIQNLPNITVPKEPTERDSYENYMAMYGISDSIKEYCVKNKYFSPENLDVFGYITSPIEKYIFTLREESYFNWYAVYNGLSKKSKQVAYEFYEEFKKIDFSDKNIAEKAQSWNTIEFFVNLDILSVEEYSVLAADMSNCNSNNDIIEKTEKYAVEYAEGLLICYWFGDFAFNDLTDSEQEAIFDYLDDHYSDMFYDIHDMGEVLELLGYEVEYENDGSLTAYW